MSNLQKLRSTVQTLQTADIEIVIELWCHPTDKCRQLAVDCGIELYEDESIEPHAPQLRVVAD